MGQQFSESSEPEFGILLKQIFDGQRPFDDLFRNSEFWMRLRRFVHRYDFGGLDGYGPQDLTQSACLKVWEKRDTFGPANTPNESAFFGWLRLLVRCTFLDEVRKRDKAQRNGWSRDPESSGELEIPVESDNQEARYYFGRYQEFIKRYPERHQRVIELWLTDYTYREIEQILNSEGIGFSHVTIRNWVITSLKEFKKSLAVRYAQLETNRSNSRAGSLKG